MHEVHNVQFTKKQWSLRLYRAYNWLRAFFGGLYLWYKVFVCFLVSILRLPVDMLQFTPFSLTTNTELVVYFGGLIIND